MFMSRTRPLGLITCLLLSTTACQSSSSTNSSNMAAESASKPSEQMPTDSKASGLSRQIPSVDASALKSAASGDQVKRLYDGSGWQAVWSPAAAKALDDAVAQRARNGLDQVDFGKDGEALGSAAADVARTRLALAYASALASGYVDPKTLHEVYTIPRPSPDLAAGLLQALRSDHVGAWFASLAPQTDEYRKLSQAYLQNRQEAQHNANDRQITLADTIHPGDHDPRVPLIAAQLRALGYSVPDVAPSSQPSPTPTSSPTASGDQGPVYTPQLAQAVKALQANFGIKTDGVIGSDTLEVLNTSPADKARALAVGMERLRWLERNPPATRIDVNTAAAQLSYYRNGKMIDQRKVVVGEPDKETPPLQAPIYRLVANPTWTVPKSVEASEMSNVGPAYLKAHNMVRKGGYIVQQPGPQNALGLVKFDMQDGQEIYLHDTSAPSLFQRTQRQLSHGCVRVDNALNFAASLAQQEGVTDQWQQARQSGKETFVPLPNKIPVRLLYHDVFVGPDGQVAFRTDPYNWNGAVAEKLGFAARAGQKGQSGDVDLGP